MRYWLQNLIAHSFLPFWQDSGEVFRVSLGFPGGSVVKNPPASAGDVSVIPGSGRSLTEGMTAPSSILAWRIPGQRSLAGSSPWGAGGGGPQKSQT